jgi:CRP-like cAMP-binding protein
VITLRQYSAGETIVREHDPGETAYIIESGRVEITKEVGSGRMHLAFLGAGEVFAEMSLVDDSPRSATVTAVEPTVIREFHREEILAAMKENPEAVIRFLKNIFERLREANLRLAQLEVPLPPPAAGDPPARPQRNIPDTLDPAGSPRAPHADPASILSAVASRSRAAAAERPAETAPPSPPQASGAPHADVKPALYTIEALTPRAAEAIYENPFTFSSFPLKIGRRTNDPLVSNHLEIADRDPLQISRHHVSIIRENGRIGVEDQGSHLGALVDDVRIGGKKNNPGPVFFKGGEGVLVLGTDSSPYRYRIGPKPAG